MAEIKVKKSNAGRPKKMGEAPKAVKPHHTGKVKAGKKVKAMNTKSNYGVKNG